MDAMTFGEKVAKLVDRAGITQKDLATSLGLSESRVSEWLHRGTAPKLTVAARLAKILGVPVDYLADDDQDEPPSATRTDQERRILEIAAMLGYEVALARLINAPGAPSGDADAGWVEGRLIPARDARGGPGPAAQARRKGAG
jgi:transcriptional regulator with XRE-family HTH domain